MRRLRRHTRRERAVTQLQIQALVKAINTLTEQVEANTQRLNAETGTVGYTYQDRHVVNSGEGM